MHRQQADLNTIASRKIGDFSDSVDDHLATVLIVCKLRAPLTTIKFLAPEDSGLFDRSVPVVDRFPDTRNHNFP